MIRLSLEEACWVYGRIVCGQSSLDTIVLEKLSAGGQMALSHQIDNYPGFEEGIDGFSLGEKMQLQAERFGAKTEYAEVSRIDFGAEPKVIETSEGTFFGRTVVFFFFFFFFWGQTPESLESRGKRIDRQRRGLLCCL